MLFTSGVNKSKVGLKPQITQQYQTDCVKSPICLANGFRGKSGDKAQCIFGRGSDQRRFHGGNDLQRREWRLGRHTFHQPALEIAVS